MSAKYKVGEKTIWEDLLASTQTKKAERDR